MTEQWATEQSKERACNVGCGTLFLVWVLVPLALWALIGVASVVLIGAMR